jgi:hypothetical protein
MFPFVPRKRRKQCLLFSGGEYTFLKGQNPIGGLKDTLKGKLALRMELFLLASIVIAPSAETGRDIHPRGQLWLLKQLKQLNFPPLSTKAPRYHGQRS